MQQRADDRTLLSSASASASASGSTPESPDLQQPQPPNHSASVFGSASSSFSEHSPGACVGERRISNTQQHLYQKAAVGVFTGTRLRQLRRRRQCGSPSASGSGSLEVFSGSASLSVSAPANSPPFVYDRRNFVSVCPTPQKQVSPIPPPHRPKSLSISVPRPHADRRDLNAIIDPHHLKAPSATLSVASPEHLLNLSPRIARLGFGRSRQRPPLERGTALAISPVPNSSNNNKFTFSFFKSASNR